MRLIQSVGYLLLSLFLLFPSLTLTQNTSFSHERRFLQINPIFNPQLRMQYASRFPVKFEVQKMRSESGNSELVRVRKAGWVAKNLEIEVDHGTYEDGYITLDSFTVKQCEKGIWMRIRDKEFPNFTHTVKLPVPCLKGIRLFRSQEPIQLGQETEIYIEMTFSDGYTRNLHRLWRPPHRTIRSKQAKLDHFEIITDHPITYKQKKLSLVPNSESSSEIAIIVRSKVDTSIADTLIIPIDYNSSQSFSFQSQDYRKNTPTVNVFVKKIGEEGAELLWVKAESPDKSFTTVINPAVARVRINCRGKDGDNGSDGSDGSDGSTDPPSDGWSGDDGSDGEDGQIGGEVFIYTDVESEFFLDAVEIDNSGGSGGAGGQGGSGGSGGPGKCDGSDGADGNYGSDGEDGPPIEIYYLPGNSLMAMIKNKELVIN